MAKISEEQVCKSVLTYLIKRGWHIHSYDFPQSGTGRLFKPKGQEAWIPDIVATKDGNCLISENKDRYYPPDFKKLAKYGTDEDYLALITRFISLPAPHFLLCVGLPESCTHLMNSEPINLIISVHDETLKCQEYYGILP